MSFEERLQKEKQKYIEVYKSPGYKMGVKRKEHAINIVKNWNKSSYLDIGCGRGEMLDFAKAAGFTKVYGVEIVDYLVKAREDVILADAANLPFSDKEIDYITMLDVVEHIPDEDIYDIFKELKRVANKKILLCIANFPSFYKGMNLHINIKPYAEWDNILKKEFEGWIVDWVPRRRNISETWEITYVE